MRRLRRIDNAYTQSVNTIIQGSAAEVMNAAMSILRSHIRGIAYPVLVVHDELIIAAPRHTQYSAQTALEVAMIAGWHMVFPDADSGLAEGLVEAKIGNSWHEAH
jgi:DNA polymerase I-like protein with 3'-5' exonuclease and polymerase domains